MNYRMAFSSLLSGAVFLLFLPISILNAASSDWQTLTEKRDIVDVTYLDGRIWCASTGGLVSIDILDQSFESYTIKDGLAGVAIDRVVSDGSGIWMIFSNRVLQRFEPGRGITHTVTTIRDDSQKINDLVIDSSGIFVAYDKGIAFLRYEARYDIWSWFSRYTMIDTDYPETEVTSLTMLDGKIFAGMNHGIAKGTFAASGLPSWTVYNIGDGITAEAIVDIAELQGNVYAATATGMYGWNGTTWSSLSSRVNIKKLENLDDKLIAVIGNGIYEWKRPWTVISALQHGFTSVTVDSGGRIWGGLARSGTEKGGVAVSGDSTWNIYVPEGPGTNITLDMAFAETGELLMSGGRKGGGFGLCVWNGHEWTNFTAPDFSGRVFTNPNKSIAVDSFNNIWIGTFGGGLASYRFTEDGELDTIFQFNYDLTTGRRLVGINANPEYVVASGVDVDQQGNLWVTNREALNGQVLVCIPREFVEDPTLDIDWYYFHRSLFGNFVAPDLIKIDGLGRKWLASSSNTPLMGRGVWVLDDHGTPIDPSDDRSYGPIAGLGQLEALSIAWDPAGYIWLGTIDGAYYINAQAADPGTQSFNQIYSLINWPVYAIEIDPQGNKWFGTNSGIKVLSEDLYTVIDTITTSQSELLPDNRVRSIAVDPNTGWAYIGTESGLGAVRTPYRDYGENIDKIILAPNPFNPNQGTMRFLDGLAGNASARIFTPDGRLMRSLSHYEAAMGWDGLDDNGRKVANGVYLVLTYNGKGQAGQGKIAVIWK